MIGNVEFFVSFNVITQPLKLQKIQNLHKKSVLLFWVFIELHFRKNFKINIGPYKLKS